MALFVLKIPDFLFLALCEASVARRLLGGPTIMSSTNRCMMHAAREQYADDGSQFELLIRMFSVRMFSVESLARIISGMTQELNDSPGILLMGIHCLAKKVTNDFLRNFTTNVFGHGENHATNPNQLPA